MTFRLRGGSVDGGELFFTTDAKTTLPRGTRIEFDVKADGNWHDVEIKLPTSKSIQQLRLEGPRSGERCKVKKTQPNSKMLPIHDLWQLRFAHLNP